MRLGAVILAAGAGRRMGGVAKALLRRGERTFLESILRTAREVGLGPAVVVTRASDAATWEHALDLGAEPIVNPEPDQGMSSSVAIGFGAIAKTIAEAAWLWPVDHPDVTADTLRRIAAALGSNDVAVPRAHGRGGHPPLVARPLFERLAALGIVDGGARAVFAGAGVSRAVVEVDDEGVWRDVDTLSALRTI